MATTVGLRGPMYTLLNDSAIGAHQPLLPLFCVNLGTSLIQVSQPLLQGRQIKKGMVPEIRSQYGADWRSIEG